MFDLTTTAVLVSEGDRFGIESIKKKFFSSSLERELETNPLIKTKLRAGDNPR